MILIALGANLPSRFGKPEETLAAAKRTIEGLGIKILCSSGIWVTSPVPASEQPWYRNAVISIQTSLNPGALMALLRAIEDDFGRIRAERDASRIIDLDIIVYDDISVESEDVVLPHPRMHERAFVLYPLREIAPEWVHPVLGLNVEQLILRLPEGQNVHPPEIRAA